MFDPQCKWPWSNNSARLLAILVGVVAVFVVLAGIDAWVTSAVMQLAEAVRAPFYVITRAGNSDWILIPTLSAMIVGAIAAKLSSGANAVNLPTKLRSVAALSGFVFACVAGTGLVVVVLKRLVGRARPVNFDQYGPFYFEPINMDWAFQSFPSGDTTTIFALAMAIMFLFPRFGKLAMFGAALVGLSRIMVGMHFPSDVFGGVLLGTLGAFSVRNFFAHRGWLFQIDAAGRYRPNIFWSAISVRDQQDTD